MSSKSPPGIVRIEDRRRCAAAVASAIAAVVMGCVPRPDPPRNEIVIDGPKTFPENITSTRDGTIISGSLGSGGVFKAPPGAAIATRWISSGDNGLLDTFGVLADERASTLWVCSSRMDPPAAGALPTVPALFNYDLKTGAFRSKHALPGGRGLCNDIAIGPDKAVYVADTTGGRVLRLPAGGTTLQEWSKSPDLAGADGLDFLGRQLFVNSFTTGKLLRVDLRPDGSAGAPVTLKTSRPLTRPDGMRRLNADQFVLAQGGGTIDLLTVRGDRVEVQILRSGLIGPSGVTVVGDTLWALEAKLSMRGTPGAQPAPFKAYALKLPAR